MTTPLAATVIVPTHEHGRLLRRSIGSALAQTVADFELFIIGDGATPETREVAEELTRLDPRVRYVDRPKSPRTGEPYRHELLPHARGEVVCYLSSDDLWLPDHLATMRGLLADADFACTMPVCVHADGVPRALPVDLAIPFYRAMILRGENRVPLPVAGHRLAAYRRLPHGWRTTPAGTPTDLYMWQQVLGEPWLRAASARFPTAVLFPSAYRRGWPLDRRAAEMDAWVPRLPGLSRDADFLHALLADGLFGRLASEEWAAAQAGAAEGARIHEGFARAEAAAARAEVAALVESGAGLASELAAARAVEADLRAALAAAHGSRTWRAVNRLRGAAGRLSGRRPRGPTA